MRYIIIFLIILYLSILFLIFFCPIYFSPDSPLNWKSVDFKILGYQIHHNIILFLKYQENCTLIITENIETYRPKIIGHTTFQGIYNLITQQCATKYSEPLFAFLYVFLGLNAVIFLSLAFYKFWKYYNQKLNDEFIEQRQRILEDIRL